MLSGKALTFMTQHCWTPFGSNEFHSHDFLLQNLLREQLGSDFARINFVKMRVLYRHEIANAKFQEF